MLHILPLIIWSGFSYAYWFSLVNDLITSKLLDKNRTEQQQTILLALSILGLGEAIGALVMSQIIDRAKPKIHGVVIVCNIVPVWALAYGTIRTEKIGALLYFFTFAWGYMDGQVNTHLL